MSMTVENQSRYVEERKTVPKVSVIIATYRRKETLIKSLLSLISQSYSNIEIIVIDDNADSDWNSEVEKIIDLIQFDYKVEIIYIKNKQNKGSAETRNIGIKHSTGEYITFLDDDDIYLPEKVKKQVEHMIKSKSDYSLTDLWLYSEDDKLIEKRVRSYIKNYDTESLIKYHLMYHMTGTDVMMFKKSYLLDIGMFSLINVGDEFYLMQKAIEGKGKFNYLPGCDVKAYVHSETEGLSSGDGKIKGENELFEYKKKYFDRLTNIEIRYIKMRHFGVIAYAELRRSNYLSFIINVAKSFFTAPIQFVNLILNRK